jgi:hypothetical protein
LESKNLIVADSGKCKLTAAGEQLRQNAENATDAYFYAPWDCLDAEELEALEILLTRLTEEMGKKRSLRCP